MKILLVILFLTLSVSAVKAEEDHTLAWMATGAILVDWGTTLDIKHHDNLYESNYLLGRHPSDRQIHLFTATKLGVLYGLNNSNMSKTLKTVFNTLYLVVATVAVSNNLRLGLRIRF